MRLPGWFSSIHAKIFFWFWLVIFLSIFLTRFISAQLANDSRILPAVQKDAAQLQRLTGQMTSNTHEQLSALFQHFSHHPFKALWSKNLTTNEIQASARANTTELTDYLASNSFHELISIEFPHIRLTGPVEVVIDDVKYQLYLSARQKKPHLGRMILNLPHWARIVIPLLISFVLCWLLAKHLSRPILKIQQAAHQFGDGNLSARVDVLGARNDELGQLAQSFNVMAAKLEHSLNAQQRLLADVSHELRSPLTRLQLALGLAQQTSGTSGDLQKYLTRCETEISRLDDMIANVLVLSRLENALKIIDSTEIELNQLMTALVQDAQFIADAKQVTVRFTTQSPCYLMADPQLLASAIGNVLTNAVNYSPQNSEVVVTLTKDDHHIIIGIVDHGTGVPSEALAQLFEPFYRVQQARDRNTGGTGLGLAIAKQAILAHHGQISARNNSNGGFTVEIKLPVELCE